jgi:spermidine synthase
VAVYAGVYLFPELPYLFLELFRAARDAPAWFNAGRFALAGSIMLVPTLLLGATFPLAVRCQRLGAEEAARPVGFLYAVNTLGAIVGSLAAGFLLIPSLGLRHTVIVGALVNLSVGAFLLAVSPGGRRALRYALAGFLVLLMPGLLLGAPPWNPLVMTSGVFQYAPTYVDVFPTRKEFFDYHAAHQQLFYRDGLTTTVTVEKRPMRRDGNVWLVLTVNGKVDASSVGDMETQVLLGQLPMLMAPDPRRVMVIGWGSGITAGSILTHRSAESVRALEIEPAIIDASRFFQDHNNRPLDDPRLAIEINDARHALLVDQKAYDVIVSEPSNPWLSGPSRLFTREFFMILRERLAPGGILCQWVQLYGLEVESYKTLLRTLADVFGEVLVFKGSPGDTLVVAGAKPIRLDVARIAERMQAPAVAADLLRAKVDSPASLFARFRIGGPVVGSLVGPGPLNTDDNSLIEFAAARSLHVTSDFGNDRMLTRAPSSVLDHVDAAGLPPEKAARLPLALARELIAAELPERASNALSRVAASDGQTPEMEAEVEALRGELHARADDRDSALASWERALEIDPLSLTALLGIGEHLRTGAGDTRAALTPLRRAVEAHPDAADARLALGRALREVGQAREAAEILGAETRRNPPARLAPFLHMEWGRACFASGDNECAIRELTRYFRGWREIARPAEISLGAALDLGGAYMVEGRVHEALEHLRVAAELGGSLANWRRDQAREALERGNAESAESHLRRAIDWHATDARAYHTLGDLLMAQGRWQEAHEHWTALLERHPGDALALRGAVEALSRLGRLSEGVPLIRRLIDLEEDPRQLAILRAALERAGRTD